MKKNKKNIMYMTTDKSTKYTLHVPRYSTYFRDKITGLTTYCFGFDTKFKRVLKIKNRLLFITRGTPRQTQIILHDVTYSLLDLYFHLSSHFNSLPSLSLTSICISSTSTSVNVLDMCRYVIRYALEFRFVLGC